MRKITIQGEITVRRQTFWSQRYGFIEVGKGLVYTKSKENIKEPRIIPLRGKKLKKGTRLNGTEYIAIWSVVKGTETVDIKIAFPNPSDMDKWAKPIIDEINGEDSTQSSLSKSLTQSVALPRQEQSQGRLEPKLTSSTASRPAANFVDEAKGDEEPIETVSPKSVKSKGPKLPGYVSKFTAKIHPDDKLELDKISEEFERQAWLIDSSSSASLFYTSKTLKQIEDERNANAPQAEEEKEQEDKPPAVVLFEEHTALTIGVIVMTLILFSHVLPTFVSFILFAVATGALDYKLFLEFTKEKDEKKPDAPVKAAPKPYKVKLMTNVVGLPDDVANALFVEENRKKWDIYATILKESDSKYIFYRKSPSSCQILETRNPGKRNERKTLIEINKIKGKPYFLRLTAYSSITTEILEKVGKEAAHNYFDWLRNFVLLEDSLAEMSISVTGVQAGIEGIVGNPTLTISDMLGEIVEVDSAADGMSDTEYNDEEEKEMIHELEEEKAPLKSSPAPVSKVAPPAPTKELSPEEKFELELAQCPKDEQEYIRKAREGIKRFVEIANDPNWKQIDKKKDNIVFSMDGDGGLKWIKGEGYIDYSPEQIHEYLGRPNVQLQYDDQFAEGHTVQELSMETKFECNRFKGIWPVSGRDFCMLAHTMRDSNGRIIISAFSHEHEGCPPVKKYVRAELIWGGWILTPDPDNKNRTFAQYISQSDLKGNIPKTIVNTVSKKQGLLVGQVGEAMKKNF